MRASKHTCGPTTAEHRLDVLWQEEIDRRIEESEYPTGGHRVGSTSPAAPLKPRHVGLTSAEEHAMWLQDVNHWQIEYRAVLDDLELVKTFVVQNGDALREHGETLHRMIAEHDAMTEEYEALKAKHLGARYAHEQATERHDEVMLRVRRVANEIRATFRAQGKSQPQHSCAVEP